MNIEQIIYVLLEEAKETGGIVRLPSKEVIVEAVYHNPLASYVDENNDVAEIKEGMYGWALIIDGTEENQCSDDIEKVAARVLNLLEKGENNE